MSCPHTTSILSYFPFSSPPPPYYAVFAHPPPQNKWVSTIVSKCSWEYCLFPRAFEGAVKPRYNESPFNEVLGRTIVFTPVILKYMKNDITKTSYDQQILPVPWPLVISRFLKEGRTECFMGDSKIVNLKSKKKKHACRIVHKEAFI